MCVFYVDDPILKKAIQKQIPIINGVTCDECYASLGGGFLLLLDYTPSLKIKVEAKNVGPVRFNANIKVKDPSISGSFSKELVAPATKWVDIPLGYGFFLNYKFGGLSALVTGSGSLKGSAQFGAATSAKIKMAALNVDGKTSYPFSFTPGPVTPYDNSDGFTSAKLNLAIALTTIQNFRLSLGIQLLEISANFDASIGGSLTLKAGLVFNAKHVAFVNVIPPSTTERKLLNLDSSNYFVVPGDHVKILFTYEGYPTNEAITLFYSLVKPNGESISIMTKDFKTSIGSGVLEATWVVPWDTVFADMTTLQTSKLAARASTDITEIFYSPPYITLKLFTETDGIFDTPTIGEVVPSDTPYLVTWNASRLIHFQTNGWNRPDGQLIEINNILFELCGEVLKRNTNGTMVVDRTWCADIYPINGETTSLNNGSAMLVFPSVFVTYGDRFYVNIRSVDYQSVTSWSKWYFFLTTTTNTNHPSSHDLDSTHNTRSSIILSSSTDNLRKEPTKNTNLDISNSPPKNLPYPSTVIPPSSSTPVTSLLVTNYSNKNPDDRKLAVVSCTLTTPVPVYSTTFNALCGTAFTGITFSLVKFKFTIPLGDPPKPNPIGPPIVRCYDGKKNPTPPPFPFTVINNKKPTSKPSRRKPTRKPSKKPNKRPTSF